MTYDEIKAALAELPPMMVEKGMRLPCAEMHISANENCCIMLKCAKSPSSDYADEYHFFRNEDPADAIAEARAWIEALPTPEAKAQTDYMRMLADAVDFGHANNIPAKYVDPVRITQKAMTENLLTKGGE